MPIYEYRCDDCEEIFEALQRLSEEPLRVCRHCGGAAHRIVSSPAIQFLGSGWYVTDYARKGEKKGGKEGAGKDGASRNGSGKEGAAAKSDSGGAGAKEGAKGGQAAGSGAGTPSSTSASRAGSAS